MTQSDAFTTEENFGLLGDFEGDREKEKRANELTEKFCCDRPNDATVSELVEVLESLPFPGKIIMLGNIATKLEGEKLEELLMDIFNWCFEIEEVDGDHSGNQSDDNESLQDFVIVGSEEGNTAPATFNPHRQHILRVLLLVAPRCGHQGVKVFHEYMKCGSVMFRNEAILSMVNCKALSDDELSKIYSKAVDNVKTSIVKACRRSTKSFRAPFLRLLYEAGDTHVEFTDLYLERDSSFVKEQLLKDKLRTFLNSRDHQDLYLEMLEDDLKSLPNDPIGRGNLFVAWEKRLSISNYTSQNHQRILRLVDAYRPMIISSGNRGIVKERYIKESKAGNLGPFAEGYCALSLYVPSGLRPTIILDWCFSKLEVDEEGAFLPRSHAHLDDVLYTFLSNSGESSGLLDRLRKIQAILNLNSPKTFWKYILNDETPDEAPDCELKVSKAFVFRVCMRLLRSILSNRYLKTSLEALKTAMDIYKRYIGTIDTPQKGKAWLEKFDTDCTWILQYQVEIALEAFSSSDPEAQRTPATLRFGYMRLLFEHFTSIHDIARARIGVDIEALIEKAFRFFVAPCFVNLQSRAVTNGSCFAADQFFHVLSNYLESVLFPLLTEFHASSPENDVLRSRKLLEWLEKLVNFGSYGCPNLAASIVNLSMLVKARHELPEDRILDPIILVERTDGTKTFQELPVSLKRTVVLQCNNLHENVLFQLVSTFREISKWPQTKYVLTLSKDLQMTLPTLWKTLRPLDGKIEPSDRVFSLAINVLATPELKSLITTKELSQLQEKAAKVEVFRGDLIRSLAVLGMHDIFAAQIDTRGWSFICSCTELSHPKIREYLEEKTHSREVESRFEAYQMLLSLSVKTNLREFSKTVQYIAKRTMNEAGNQRSPLYRAIVNNIAVMVKSSLKIDAFSQEVVEDTRTICDSILSIYLKDLKKRDSVGYPLAAIGNIAIESIINVPYDECLQPVHEQWYLLATRLQWASVETKAGEERLSAFVWSNVSGNFQNYLPDSASTKYIDGELQTKISLCNPRAGPQIVHTMKRKFWRERRSKFSNNLTHRQITPERFFELAVSSYECVQREHITKIWEQFGEEVPATSFESDSRRLEWAVNLFRHNWVAVPKLVEMIRAFFSKMDIFSNEECSSVAVEHFRSAMYLLRNLVEVSETELSWRYNEDARWMTTSLLKFAIQTEHIYTNEAVQLFDGLCKIEVLESQLNGVKLSPLDVAILGSTATVVKLKNQIQRSKVNLQLCKEILTLTESAIFLPLVNDMLLKFRDDQIGKYFYDTPRSSREFYGVFHPKFTVVQNETNATEDASELLIKPFHQIPRSYQRCLNSSLLRIYAKHALSCVQNRVLPLQSKIDYLVEYQLCPAVGLHELQTVFFELANDDALVEVLFLNLFKTDAAWPLLSKLLSPENIASAPQRMISHLLSRLLKEVEVEKVLKVLSVLLTTDERRSKLSVSLSMYIMKALFGINHPTSSRLLRGEWESNKIHNSVRDEMIRQSLTTLTGMSQNVTGSSAAKPMEGTLLSFAWFVLEESAKNYSANEAFAMLLLAPRWDRNGISTKDLPFECNREVARRFLQEQDSNMMDYKRSLSASPSAEQVALLEKVGKMESLKGLWLLPTSCMLDQEFCNRWRGVIESVSSSTTDLFLQKFAKLLCFEFRPELWSLKDPARTVSDGLLRFKISEELQTIMTETLNILGEAKESCLSETVFEIETLYLRSSSRLLGGIAWLDVEAEFGGIAFSNDDKGFLDYFESKSKQIGTVQVMTRMVMACTKSLLESSVLDLEKNKANGVALTWMLSDAQFGGPFGPLHTINISAIVAGFPSPWIAALRSAASPSSLIPRKYLPKDK